MTSTATGHLTRTEEAYAHLASFQRGDEVDVGGPGFYQPGHVIQAQRADGDDMTATYVIVSGCSVVTLVSVADLLAGRRTLISAADAKAGNIRYFDQAGYAAQNG